MVVAFQSHQLSGIARALGRIAPPAGHLRFLEQVGGSRLVTAVGAAGDADLAHRWLSAAEAPNAEQRGRLRDAAAAAWLLCHHMPVEGVTRWFRTREDGLGTSPVLALRRGRGAELLTAAGRTAAVLGDPTHQPPYFSCGEH